MSGVNKVIIIGRLGNEPELKQTAGGQSVCTLSIATSEAWKDQNGQKQERTEWHRVVVWGKSGENCAKYLSKGRQAYVEGRLQTRSWEDQNGQKKYSTEIVASTVQFLGGGAGAGASDSYGGSSQANNNNAGHDFTPEPFFDASEDVPF
jgi:single-strand DNA-binding protein